MEPLNLMVSLSFYGNDQQNRKAIKRTRRPKRATNTTPPDGHRNNPLRRAALRLKTLGA